MEEIFKDPQVKKIFEALLIDKNTPEEVFIDLFGVDKKFVDAYKYNHPEGLWNNPRIALYSMLQRLQDAEYRELCLNVFNGGWEVVDALFNRGKNINAGEVSMKIIKIASAKAVGDAIYTGKLNSTLINAAKNMVSTVQTYNNIDASGSEEDWRLIIRQLEERSTRASVSDKEQDAYAQVMDKLKDKEVKDASKVENNKE